jgi:hypothetical protein
VIGSIAPAVVVIDLAGYLTDITSPAGGDDTCEEDPSGGPIDTLTVLLNTGR